jgi:hypothetical protein
MGIHLIVVSIGTLADVDWSGNDDQ